MERFIEDFDSTTGIVTSINKKYSNEMIFERYYHNVEIKKIGKNACSSGSATIVDLYNTAITSIESAAFSYCPLTQIIFPNTLEEILINAFFFSTVPYVFTPENVINIDPFAFNLAPNINYFDVSHDNLRYSSVNGFLMNKDAKIVYEAPRSIKEIFLIMRVFQHGH